MSGEIRDDFPWLSSLLFGASERYCSVRAKILYVVDTSVAEEANRRFVDWRFERSNEPDMEIIGKPGEPAREDFYQSYSENEITDEMVSIWHERPDRWREERRTLGGVLTSCIVATGDGGPWWIYKPTETALYVPDVPADERLDMSFSFLLDPSEEFFRTTLTDDVSTYKTGREDTVAGRKAVEVRVGTVSWRYPPVFLPGFEASAEGTTDHLIMVDAKIGTILRVAARLEGREFRVAEVTEIVYDEELTEGTFRLDMPSVKFRRDTP